MSRILILFVSTMCCVSRFFFCVYNSLSDNIWVAATEQRVKICLFFVAHVRLLNADRKACCLLSLSVIALIVSFFVELSPTSRRPLACVRVHVCNQSAPIYLIRPSTTENRKQNYNYYISEGMRELVTDRTAISNEISGCVVGTKKAQIASVRHTVVIGLIWSNVPTTKKKTANRSKCPCGKWKW